MSRHATTTRRAAFASLLVVGLVSAASVATPLTGSGPHIAIPSPNPGAPLAQARTVSSGLPGGWVGSWSAPVLAPWVGSFKANGPVPTGNTNPTGVTLYDFTSLPAGALPAGTYFRFGNVDAGSNTPETFVLAASNAGGIITTPWLDEAVGVTGASYTPSDLPAWSLTAGVYTIDGSALSGNPNAGFFLPSNIPITSLELTRSSTFENFALYAPLPEPGALALMGLALPLLLLRRSRSRANR